MLASLVQHITDHKYVALVIMIGILMGGWLLTGSHTTVGYDRVMILSKVTSKSHPVLKPASVSSADQKVIAPQASSVSNHNVPASEMNVQTTTSQIKNKKL